MICHLPNEAGGCIERLRTGMCQSDLLIAKLHSINNPSILTGNDADFMMLMGNSHAQINSFTHSLKNSEIRKMTLILSSNRNAAKSQET